MSIEGGGGGRGLYRGMGCAACHVLFGAEGRYEGKDKALLKSIKESEEASDRALVQSSEKANVSATVKEYGGIPRAEEGIEVTGHVLVNSIQSSQKAKVSANGKEYSGINGLAIGLEQIVDRSGKQTQTVGSHWPLSRPLTDSQRARLDRGGTCLACHKDLPKGTIPIAMLKNISETFNYSFAEKKAHVELLAENNRLIALVKFAGISGGILLLGALIIFLLSKRYAKG